MDPVSLGVMAIGTTIAGASISALQAAKQNSAAEASARAANAASTAQQKQLIAQAQQAKAEKINQSELMYSRLRVASGESGLNPSGLENQIGFDTLANLGVLDTNLANNLEYARAKNQQELASIEAQTTNPLLATLMGGLQGASTGLSISSGVLNIQNAVAQNALNTAKLADAAKLAARSSDAAMAGGLHAL